MLDKSSQLLTLTRVNVQDLLAAWGLGRVRRGRRWLEWLVTPAARQFAREIIAYDDGVSELGLQAASQGMIERLVHQLEVRGQEHIPPAGPALILSNHPGLMDTVALFAALPRVDLRVIAADRPFLRALPNCASRLIYVQEQAGAHVNVVREATRHLRQGGAILTFPAGHIEPDPEAMPGAVESLQTWAASVAVFARLAPQTRIIPAIVSGVMVKAALQHPLTRLRRKQQDREWLGATIQILLQRVSAAYKPPCVRVSFGKPLLAADLVQAGETTSVMRAVTAGARALIEGLC
jgi:1-acyl-sn-glycerol-3-phosphate acyltransferase